ncbi:hypothetical protein ADUPG1_005262, partial [Aduncisulcus paluster]
DWDLFSIAGLSLLTTLSLSGNSLTDISLLYQLSSLVTLDVTSNKLCNVNNSSFDTFFDGATVTAGSETDFDQDSTFCDECSADSDSISPASNIVCRAIWTDVYRIDCAMYSYRDYSSTDALSCVGLTVGTTYTCLTDLESNSNIQCVNEDVKCLQYLILVSKDGSDFGICGELHQCSCNDGYRGDACEYIDYGSLGAFICAEIAAASGLVTLVSGTSLTCVDGEISVDELCNVSGLDLSTSGLTSIDGLSYATSLAELHLDTLSFDGEATSSLDLSELVGLPLTTLTLDNTNIVIDATIL